MKKFLALFFLMASAVMAQGQQPIQAVGPFGAPDCQIGPITMTSIGASPAFDNRFTGCTTWVIYTFNSHMLAYNVQIEQSADLDGTPNFFAVWPLANVGSLSTQTINSTNTSKTSTYFGYFAWVRVNVTSFTQASAGPYVTYEVYGYRSKFGADSNSLGLPSNTNNNVAVDPCMSSSIAKTTVPINITTATTTSLVAASGSTTVTVCGISATIAPSGTTADTVLFEYGTGAACVTVQIPVTGTFGNGDLTTTTGVTHIVIGEIGSTIAGPGTAFCAVTAGTTVNVQGTITFVQR